MNKMNLELNENSNYLPDSYIVREALASRMRELKKRKKEMLQYSSLCSVEGIDEEIRLTKNLWKQIIDKRGDTEFNTD
jgi:hypothetical protein